MNKRYISWNTNLTKDTDDRLKQLSINMKRNNPMNNEESRRKLSSSLKGRIPWNKGLKSSDDSRILGGKDHPYYGKNFSKETRNKISISKKGKYMGSESSNWKGGITPLDISIRNSDKMDVWRNTIFKIDNYQCRMCGDDKGGNLNAHHIRLLSTLIYENNIKTIDDALNCDKLWGISNGITLCKNCHRLLHKLNREAYKCVVIEKVVQS